MSKKEPKISPELVEAAVSRRDFLSLGTGAAVALTLGLPACSNGGEKPLPGNNQNHSNDPACPTKVTDKAKPITWDPSTVTHNKGLFPLGVQAGVMTQSTALLWSFTEDNLPKQLRVWRTSSKPGEVLLVEDLEVSPNERFFHSEVASLIPGQRYYYAFLTKGNETFSSRTRIGSFRTAYPNDCKKPVRIAATACTNVALFSSFRPLQIMAQQDFDLLCHLGDFSYNDGAFSKEGFHANWRRTLEAPGYGEILARSGLYATWDDHEKTNDDQLYSQSEEFHRIGRDAYLRHVAQPQDHPEKLFWRSYRWGQSVEFFVLDCRGERIPEKKTYISQEQMEWCKKGLQQSPCHFKVILNSVPMIAFPPAWKSKEADRWEGYPEQRNELLDHIVKQNVRNVWFLAGDYHVGAVAKIEATGPRSHMREIMVGPAGNVVSGSTYSVLVAAGANTELVTPKAQFDFFRTKPSATFLTFDPEKNQVRVEFIDPATNKHVLDQVFQQELS